MSRTDVDFSKHEVIVKKSEDFLSHYLKLPNTVTQGILFINTNDIMAVTGDYGNWIFCREFHPSATGSVSDRYWIEKLKICSCQDPFDFDSDVAKKEIEELKLEHEFSEEEKEWLDDLSDEADQGEYAYIAKAMGHPNSFDTEMIPRGQSINWWLSVVFDGFEEICNRIKKDDVLYRSFKRRCPTVDST